MVKIKACKHEVCSGPYKSSTSPKHKCWFSNFLNIYSCFECLSPQYLSSNMRKQNKEESAFNKLLGIHFNQKRRAWNNGSTCSSNDHCSCLNLQGHEWQRSKQRSPVTEGQGDFAWPSLHRLCVARCALALTSVPECGGLIAFVVLKTEVGKK